MTPQDRCQLLGQRPVAELRQVQRLGDRRQNELGIADRGQRDEDRPIGEAVLDTGCDLLGESGFADPAGTSQRHKPNIGTVQEVTYGRNLPLAADKRSERNGKGADMVARVSGDHGAIAPGFSDEPDVHLEAATVRAATCVQVPQTESPAGSETTLSVTRFP